jgi:hypothetical protein
MYVFLKVSLERFQLSGTWAWFVKMGTNWIRNGRTICNQILEANTLYRNFVNNFITKKLDMKQCFSYFNLNHILSCQKTQNGDVAHWMIWVLTNVWTLVYRQWTPTQIFQSMKLSCTSFKQVLPMCLTGQFKSTSLHQLFTLAGSRYFPRPHRLNCSLIILSTYWNQLLFYHKDFLSCPWLKDCWKWGC